MTDLSKIRTLLTPDAKIVVLTGAGVSAESGIPTFRDPHDGLWAAYDPEELASARGFRKDPALVMDWYSWRRSVVLKSRPNPGHEILAKWESQFANFTLITQNVDGLHTAGGSRRVLEMHGNIHKLKCFDNGHECNWPESTTDKLICTICGSLLRPDIVWFGETLATDILSKIYQAVEDCDIFFAIGTSGLVYPAAGLLDEAKQHGATRVVINPDKGSRGNADYYMSETASQGLALIDRHLDSN